MADSRLDDLSGAARPEDLCGRLLGRGAALLLLLDTCYDQANGLRRPRFGWSENFPPGDSDVFALTCSASRDADARFYSRALTHVIVTAEASTTARYLSLDMVGHGLNAYAQDVTDSPDRELTFHTHSDETRRNRFFPNPRYLADDLAPFVLRPATSAGGDSNALNAVTSWLRPPDGDGGGLLVVTGGPGSGKTSLLRRLVAFADPARAAEFAEQAMYWPAAYGQVVALRANRATLADLRGALAARLDVPLTGDDGPQDLRSQPDTPVLVVIDALDKTRGGPEEGEAAIRELLLPLARRSRIRVVAATRPELLPAFVPRPEIVDLDALQYRVPDAELYLFETLRRYPRRPADGSPVGPHGAPDKAHRWSRTIAERIGQSATMARFLARRALEAFVGDWVTVDDFLQRELPAALDAYTDTFGNDRQEAGQLLRALAYAQGDGFPSTSEWAAVAAAVTREPVTAVDIDRYLARSDGLVLTLWSPSDNSMRYRLPHPSVAEVLRVGDDPRQVHADIAASLASRLLGAGESAFDFPDRPLASEYAEEHLATHAAAGGTLDDYLTDPAFVRRSSPRTLGAVLDSWRSPLARAVEETLRAATVPPGCSDAEAHDILALSALMLGHSSLAEKYAGAAGWTPAWAAPDIPAVSLGSAVLDGRDLVVAGAKDGSVWLLDPGSGSRVTGIQRDADPVTAVSCVSIDGRPHAVASAQDGTVSVWDLIAGSLRTATVSPAGPVPAVACTTVEGRPFAVYCRTERAGSTVYLWDLVTGVTASTFTTDAAATSTLACATVDGTPYAVLAAGRSVSLWNLREPQPGGEEQQDAAVTAVACGSARDTPIAFLGLEDGSVHTQYFNGLSARVTRRRKHSSPVVAVVTGMLDGRLFGVSSDAEGVTHVWETARPGSPVWSLRLPRRATALHFAAGRLTIAMDGPLIAVDLRARR
jgi:hypothetical protein